MGTNIGNFIFIFYICSGRREEREEESTPSSTYCTLRQHIFNIIISTELMVYLKLYGRRIFLKETRSLLRK